MIESKRKKNHNRFKFDEHNNKYLDIYVVCYVVYFSVAIGNVERARGYMSTITWAWLEKTSEKSYWKHCSIIVYNKARFVLPTYFELLYYTIEDRFYTFTSFHSHIYTLSLNI